MPKRVPSKGLYDRPYRVTWSKQGGKVRGNGYSTRKAWRLGVIRMLNDPDYEVVRIWHRQGDVDIDIPVMVAKVRM